MNAHIIILILALVGFGESCYLIYERKRKRPPVCVIGNECGEVWASPYSRTLGIPNEILGVVFYTVIAVVEVLLYRGDTSLVLINGEYAILIAGTFMSCYFTYLQWRVICAWCFWCTLSAVITVVMIATRLLF